MITFEDETLDKVFVMEANGRGFMLVPWFKWRKSNALVARYEVDVDEEKQLASLRELAKDLGAEYDYVSVLGFVFRRFLRRMRNPLDNTKKFICSEAVAKFLYLAGLEQFKDFGTFVPEDLYEIARKDDTFLLKE